MRDKLIELIEDTLHEWECDVSKETVSEIAEHLIENDVIVPPCKVGATLYFLYDRPHADKPDLTPRIYETNELYFDVDEKGVSIKPKWVHGYKGVPNIPKVTNFEKMKSIETEKEMAEIICMLHDHWLAFALYNESIKTGIIKWLKQECNDGT